MDSAAAAAVVVPYVVQAVETFGEKVLEKSTDVAAESAAGFGAKLVQKLFHRDGGRPQSARAIAAEVAVRDLAQSPSDDDLQAAARVAVGKLLDDDHLLAGEIAGMLSSAPRIGGAERSITTVGQSGGMNVAGDRNKVSYRQGR